MEKPGTRPSRPLTRFAPSGAPGIGPLQPYPPERCIMHVSPSGVVNAYAWLSSTANSDGFTGCVGVHVGRRWGSRRLARIGAAIPGTLTARPPPHHPGGSFCSASTQLRCCRSEQQRFQRNVKRAAGCTKPAWPAVFSTGPGRGPPSPRACGCGPPSAGAWRTTCRSARPLGTGWRSSGAPGRPAAAPAAAAPAAHHR